MTKKIFILLISLSLSTFSFSQESEKNNKLPSVDLKTLEGETINTSEFSNDGNPIIISFWATWCKPCIKELTVIAEVYEEWQDETDVKLIAVSIDNARRSPNVLPLVNGKGWEYDVYLDLNSDFKRAMNVNLIPHTFILDGSGKVVWQHTSFSEGGEEELFEVIKKVAAGESVDH